MTFKEFCDDTFEDTADAPQKNDIYRNMASDDKHADLPDEVTDEVVRHYSDMVWRLALTKTRSESDAEDIFQEVFCKLVMNEKKFASEEHRKAWIIRVTINCCNSHFVAPWRRNIGSIEDVLIDVADESAVMPGDDNGPDIYAEVLRLPDNMKEVVLLYYYEELSIREIAEILGTTEVNVKKRLSRARQKLKLELEGEV